MKHFLLLLLLLPLSSFAAEEKARIPDLPAEFLLNIFPGSKAVFAKDPVVHMNTCPHCGEPARLKCMGCKKVRYCKKECQVAHWRLRHKEECSKIKRGIPQVDMYLGQKAAYAYVEEKFQGDPERFQAKFFTLEDLQNIHRKLLSFSNDNLPPENIGLIRNEMASLPLKRYFAMPEHPFIGKGPMFLCERPTKFKVRREDEETCVWFIRNHTRAFIFDEVTTRLVPNIDFYKTCSPEELEKMRTWVREHKFIMIPHTVEEIIDREFSGAKMSIASTGEPVNVVLAKRGRDFLSSLKARYVQAATKEHIIALAAEAHEELIRTHLFGGANKRLARVVMNTILHYSGLPVVMLEDEQSYLNAILSDLKDNTNVNFLDLLKNLESRLDKS